MASNLRKVRRTTSAGALETFAVLDCSADEAWMVGDNLEWDVAAPQGLGIFAVWVDYAEEGLPATSDIIPDRTIRNIAELTA